MLPSTYQPGKTADGTMLSIYIVWGVGVRDRRSSFGASRTYIHIRSTFAS